MENTTPTQSEAQPQVVYVEKRSNGLATAALVLGILAVVFSIIPLVGIVAIPLALIAAGLAIPGFLKARKVGAGKGKSIVGMVLAIASLVLTMMVTNATVNAVDEAVTELDTTISEIGTTADEIDVTFGTPAASDLGTTLPVTIVNTSDTAESPMVTIAATSADGSEQYDTATVLVSDLAPGQSANEDADFIEDLPAGATFSVVDVV